MAAPQLTQYLQGVSILSADGLNTFESTCDNISELRDFIGTQGIQVFVRGFVEPGDGGQGIFNWTLLTNPIDDGVSVIVPYGSSGAAWLRIPTGGLISPVTTVASGSTYSAQQSDYYLRSESVV